MQWKSQWNQVKYAQFEFQMNQRWGWCICNCEIYQLTDWGLNCYKLYSAKKCKVLYSTAMRAAYFWKSLLYWWGEVRATRKKRYIHFRLNSDQRLDMSTIKWQILTINLNDIPNYKWIKSKKV